MSSATESKEQDASELDVIGGLFECKPGQKYPTPSPGNGDRVFYETLYEQNPKSEMAQEWCLLYGILPFEQANKLNMMVCKRKGRPVTSIASPQKGSNKAQASSKAAPAKASAPAAGKRRRVVDDDDLVGDSGMGPSNDWEGMGTSGL